MKESGSFLFIVTGEFGNSHVLLTVFLESVRSYYNLIIKKAGQFLTDLQVSFLKFALSLRAFSPAIHAFQQVGLPVPLLLDFFPQEIILPALCHYVGCSIIQPIVNLRLSPLVF